MHPDFWLIANVVRVTRRQIARGQAADFPITVVSVGLRRLCDEQLLYFDLPVRTERLQSIRAVCVVLLATAFLVARPEAFALNTTKPLKQYGRQSWQTDTGLPQNTVHAIVQTRDGYMWMATEGGLVRFDGQDLRTFDTSNTSELPSNSINDISTDGQGALWISTSGGLVCYEHDGFRLTTVANGLPSNMVRFARSRRGGGLLVATAGGAALGGIKGFHPLAGVTEDLAPELVTEDATGTIWIGSGQRILALTDGSDSVTSISVAELGEIQVVAAGAPGDLWIGGRNGLAVLHKGGKASRVANITMSVTALLPMPNGDLWIGTEGGLLRYAHGVAARAGEGVRTASGRVLRLFADREGAVWVAYDLGIRRIVAGDPGRLQEPIDISGTLSIFEDREGDMWLGTDVGGATILREQAFSTLTTQDGLSDDFVRAVFEDHAGTIWLGTNRGGLNRIEQGRITALRAGKGSLSSNVVLALAKADGDLWIGTPDGLSRMHDGHLKLFTTADGLPDDFVRSLYTDSDGSLWIGTRDGLSHYAHGMFTSYSRLDGLGGDLIGSILRTRDGTLYVGTIDGLSRFDGKSFRNFTAKDGLGGDAITTLGQDQEGTLWIGAHGAGLTRLREGRFTPVNSVAAGLPEEIYSVLEDTSEGDGSRTQTPCKTTETQGECGNRSLWLGSSKGVFRVSIDALNAFADGRSKTLAVASFGVADGMKISECSSGGHPAAWRMRDGTLWFATLRGAAAIAPGGDYENRVAPLTAIEDVLIDDRPAPLEEALTVQPGHDRISIHYAGLSFRAPQKVKFRYKLEGFDHNWIEAGARRTAFYTNLPAGRYRFVVLASGGNGRWSEVPGELGFTIRPHFYRTIWFYCLALLLAALLAWLIYRSRVRIVEAQYNAVLAERTRIAREIHDTLAQGYVGISVQLEVASRLLQVSKEAAAQQIENTKEYVRTSLADARSSIWNLRSPGAESETLPARLAAVVKSRQPGGSNGPSLRFDVHGSFRPVSRRVEDELVRIGQEAVSNALRHARASAIVVVLSYHTGGDLDLLKLTISDNGQGFDPDAIATGHYGVQGMRERAATIAAELVIKSEPRRTMVEVTYQVLLETDENRKEHR